MAGLEPANQPASVGEPNRVIAALTREVASCAAQTRGYRMAGSRPATVSEQFNSRKIFGLSGASTRGASLHKR